MRRLIFILVLFVFVSANAAGTKQLSKEQIEQILFDFRVGVDSKIKEQGAQQLAEEGEKVVPILIECLREKLPEPLATKIDEANRKRGMLPSLADGSSIPVQGWAETTLTRIGKSAVPKLIESIKTQPDTIDTVARILGQIGDKRAVSHLIAVLDDTNNNWWVRASAAYSLGKMRDPNAIPHLIEALKGQTNATDNTEHFSSTVAYALTQLTGQSFGFTLVIHSRITKDERMYHFLFEGSSSEKEKAIEQWRQWWKDYSKLLVDIPNFLNTYADQLKAMDITAIQKSRSADYIWRYGSIIYEDKIFMWLNCVEKPSGTKAKPKCINYTINCKDIKDEQSQISVLAEDNVTIDYDGQQIQFTAQTKRVLVKKGNSYQIKQEILSN